jgi:ribose transport system substrate-binding protein
MRFDIEATPNNELSSQPTPKIAMARKTIIAAISLCGLLAASCVAAEKTYTFGIIVKSNNNPVFQAAKTGAEDEARALSEMQGVTIKIDWRKPNEDKRGRPPKQVEAIEELVNVGVSGIAVSIACRNLTTRTSAPDHIHENS